MFQDLTPASGMCPECGGPLGSGPLGPRCARCALSLAIGTGDEESELTQVADLFPELRVEGRLARGGFGTVNRAEHRRMRRMVALKFLDGLLAHSREAVELFGQEMVTVGGLDHPGIVRAYDAGEREGRWFILMELVDGLDCGALVRRLGRLPVAEACEIVRRAALALGHAHQRGLVHRDVKPGNLMVTRPLPGQPVGASEVKGLDFGLAGLAGNPVRRESEAGESSAAGRMVIGTLEYVAPEQIENPGATDARADLYSPGATLWRLLTGKPRPGAATSRSSGRCSGLSRSRSRRWPLSGRICLPACAVCATVCWRWIRTTGPRPPPNWPRTWNRGVRAPSWTGCSVPARFRRNCSPFPAPRPAVAGGRF